MIKSKIEWTNDTWNPWQGCIKISQGCKNCYMYRDKKRYGQQPDRVVKSAPATFNAPLRMKGPYVFTCSWSDFFIEQADPWRAEAWEIIRRTPHLTYQILTKRPELIYDRLPDDWGTGWKNVWLGVSAENQEMANKRIPILMNTPAQWRFVSAEPLIGPIDFNRLEFGRKLVAGEWKPEFISAFESQLRFYDEGDVDLMAVDWVITGGESGPGYRPANPEWFESIQRQCRAADVAFFHKQNGGNIKIEGAWGGRELNGKTYSNFPILTKG